MPVKPTYEDLERRLQEFEKGIRPFQPLSDCTEKADVGCGNPSSQAINSLLANIEGAGAQKESDLCLMVENIDLMFFRLHLDSTIFYVSSYCEHLLGYTPAELRGRRMADVIHSEEVAGVRAIIDAALGRKEERFSSQHRLQHKNGRSIWVETKGRLLCGSDGSPREIQCVAHDITEMKRTERSQRQRAEELTALKELGREVNTALSLERVAEAGLQSICTAVNLDLAFFFLRQGEKLILQEIQPVPARNQFDHIPEHRVGECICGLAVTENRPIYSLDIRADGRCTWDECKKAGIRSFAALPLRGADGVIGVIGLASRMIRDFARQSEFLETLAGQVAGALVNARLFEAVQQELMERKQAEAALLESENRTRSIVDSLPIGMHIYRLGHDDHLFFIGANPAADTLLGVENKAFIGKTLEEAFPGLAGTEVLQRYKEAAELGTPWQTEQIIYHEGDIQGAFEVHAFRIAPRMMAAAFSDITERKKAEVSLQALSQRQKAMLAAIPDIIMEVNVDKIYTWANQAGLEFFGPDVVGREANFYFIEGEDIYEEVQPLFAGSEEVLYVRSWQRRIDGQKRLLAWWCRALEDEDNNVTGAISSARDITDRKHLEEQLLQAQKMESIGRLAGGVAHDFNNMLQTILGHSDLAIEKIDRESAIRGNLEEIRNAARRSADLTRQLLAFARKQTASPTILDLNDTIVGMMKILSRLIGEDIELAWKPGPNLWPVLVDPTQVDQILANLVVNARDAIAGVGTLSLGTRNVVIKEPRHGIQTDVLPGHYVVLTVTDNGCGMEKDILQNIFDPFFTTKEVGKGTGLGLATVYGIVKQNRGWITVSSEPGMGTTFSIYLPRAEQETKDLAVVEDIRPERGSETVLLVEDDASLLHLGIEILQSFGYRVLPALSPEHALAIVGQQTGPIHLLITDIVMPGMNGRDLAEKIVIGLPEIKVIFMSGYTDDVIAHHGILDHGVHFLQKPFSVHTLTGKVREVLDKQ